jgi:hypothetical protein
MRSKRNFLDGDDVVAGRNAAGAEDSVDGSGADLARVVSSFRARAFHHDYDSLYLYTAALAA